jgi:hypothetical protein
MGWAKIDPALEMRPSKSIALPLLLHPVINPALGMKRSFLYQAIMFHKIMAQVTES